MSKPTNVVLLIEDEPKIRRFLRAGFELQGFSVIEAENAADGLRAATFNAPDLIILDLALPDLHGTDVLERIRSWSNVPVIILSVVSSEDEKVRLLQSGADDYVVKPFGMAELLARSEAALRRYFKSATENPVVTAGPLSVDPASTAMACAPSAMPRSSSSPLTPMPSAPTGTMTLIASLCEGEEFTGGSWLVHWPAGTR